MVDQVAGAQLHGGSSGRSSVAWWIKWQELRCMVDQVAGAQVHGGSSRGSSFGGSSGAISGRSQVVVYQVAGAQVVTSGSIKWQEFR